MDPEYAELVVNFDTVPGDSNCQTFLLNYKIFISVEATRANYRVLATDYDNFAIVYDCVDILGVAKAESMWFLTRDQFPDQNIVDDGFK